MLKKTITFNKTRFNASKLSEFRFVFERESNDVYTITASSEKYGEWKSNIPILNLLELMGGELKTSIVDEKKQKNKNSKKKKKIKQNDTTTLSNSTVNNKKIVWDGPHDGYCYKLVKIDEKSCYTRFNTLQEAKIEAMKLGSGIVGGITESNGTFSLRVGSSLKSNDSSKKKNERSWIFKSGEVDPANESVPADDMTILTETTQDMEDVNNNKKTKMVEYIKMYSTINSDTKFTCSIWNYNGKTFTVLDDNVIMDNGHFIGMRFYGNGKYDAVFIDEYEFNK